MIEVVKETFRKKDGRGLKLLERDVAENARGLSVRDAEHLDELLVAKFGWGLSANSRQKRREVTATFADPSKAGELEQINALLAKYAATPSSRRGH